MSTLILTLLIIVTIQFICFVFAAIKRTDKLTDLAYGSTFALVSILLVMLNAQVTIIQIILALIVGVWGLRLSGYLYYRIRVTKSDKRFDGIRENVIKFGLFWLLQTISIWLILTPVSLALAKEIAMPFSVLSIIGGVIALTGIVIETVADSQKFHFKRTNPDKWIASGLWKYSRHPNYFGEILMWIGVFIYCLPLLSGFEFLAIVSPIYIILLLLYVSGVPTLESKYKIKYANSIDYQRYKERTNLLIPWFNKN